MLKIKLQRFTLKINLSFFALITFMLLTGDREAVIISLSSALLHESGHIIVMLHREYKIKAVIMTATGFCIERSEDFSSYGTEILVSLAGIAVNGLCALIAFILYVLFNRRIFFDSAVINLMIGGFNLIPAGTLDGARAMYYILLKKYDTQKAEKISSCISRAFSLLLPVFGFIVFIFTGANVSLLISLIYILFLVINHSAGLKKDKI